MNTTNTGDDDFADDLSHPIPSVQVYDTVLRLDGGGAYIGMVIAGPPDVGKRSLARLREKLRFYLESFFSDYGRREFGTPKDGKMKIYVNIHPESSAQAFEILDDFTHTARSRGVEVVITPTASNA